MSDHSTEREIKLKLENPSDLISKLNSKKAKFIGKSFQRTTRMDTESMGLEKNGVFLRVRSGSKNIVTLKRKLRENAEVFERQEIETEVEDIDKLADIFYGLGFTKRLILEKYRADFEYEGVKISVDELPFGFYVELEGDPEKIFETAKELDLNTGDKITVTYWDLFENYKKETGARGENIVFPEKYKSTLMPARD